MLTQYQNYPGVHETVWAPQGVLQPDWPLGKTNASQPPSFTCLWVENKHYHPPARLVSGCSHTSLSLEFQWLQSACLHCNSLSNSPDQGLLRWNSLFSLCNSPNQGLLHWDSLVCIPASSQTGLWVKNDASQPPPFTGLWVENKHWTQPPARLVWQATFTFEIRQLQYHVGNALGIITNFNVAVPDAIGYLNQLHNNPVDAPNWFAAHALDIVNQEAYNGQHIPCELLHELQDIVVL